MKKLLSPFLFIALIFAISGCSNSEKSPDLTMTINQKTINVVKIEDIPENNKELFKPSIEGKKSKEILHAQIGDNIILKFNNNAPDKATIQEYFLNDNGDILYTDAEIKDIEISKDPKEKNKYSFIIEKSLVSGLSSESFEEKTDLRGYKITTNIGDITSVYICSIKTEYE